MFTVIYRWKIKPDLENQFIESWSEITRHYVETCGSLGSRLHRGSDGFFYAYAQWELLEDRERAFENTLKPEVREKMREAIEESFPETRLEILADFLVLSA